MKYSNINTLNLAPLVARCLMLSPRDTIYTLLQKPKHNIHIDTFDCRTKVVAQKLIKKINNKLANLCIYHVGSSALDIPGQNDIDLLAGCDKWELSSCASKINLVLGKPSKVRSYMVEWNTSVNGYKVELSLFDKNHKLFKSRLAIFFVLRDNLSIRKEYINIKKSLSGSNERVYNLVRLEFFENAIKKGNTYEK